MPSNTFSLVEEKCGIIFASCPALRQLLAYRRRTGHLLPTKGRQPPNADFVSMRHRINLRDIFWYRKTSLENQPRVSPPGRARRGSEAGGQNSSLDLLGNKLRNLFALTPASSHASHGVGSRLRRGLNIPSSAAGGGKDIHSMERLHSLDSAQVSSQGRAEEGFPGTCGVPTSFGGDHVDARSVEKPRPTFLRMDTLSAAAETEQRSGSEESDIGLTEALRGLSER